MKKIDNVLTKVKDLYTNSLKKYGINSKSVGWTTKEGQILRFSKLCEIIEDKDTPFTANDLGCGYGALYDYLIENKFNIIQYNGYDISEDMLETAKKLIGNDNKVKLFNAKKLSTIADYSFASGIFNVKFEADENEWKLFVEDTLKNMNKYSLKGFAFNALTSYVEYRETHLYYADPLYFFDFCKRNFSKKVSLLHDYDLWEWTILVKKD